MGLVVAFCVVAFASQAQLQAEPKAAATQGVVVVLAGGGAKGFAHLAVLRQLEKDKVPIARIVGTSMGAVIGSLYASGMPADDIERVIAATDPFKMALDQIDRFELSPHARAYQQQYPINFEFGINERGLSFSRGVSDGQRFSALLQQLFAHLPASMDFDELKIPLRVVATRYRDGRMRVFDRGVLHLAVRASMAAPGVFAPVEVDGEVYVDGGLVANLPVEVALSEGAGQIVASYLGQSQEDEVRAENAWQVAEHMITLLLKQNEQRNLAMLRPHDVLVQPLLNDIAFADFHRAREIIGRGEVALASVDAAWQKMLQSKALFATAAPSLPVVKKMPICLAGIRISGHENVSADFVHSRMADLQGKLFDASEVAQRIDQIYTTGYFEQVTYSLEPLDGVCHAMVVHVKEKPYGPHFFKTALGFSTELDGVTQVSLGVGYRRPWLTSEGLELQLGARVGTLTELSVRLVQPMGVSWRAEAGFSMHSNAIPVYEPLEWSRGGSPRKFAYMRDLRQEVSASIGREFDNESIMKLGLVQAVQRYKVDVSKTLLLDNGAAFTMPDYSLNYSAVRWQWDVDQLDAVSFPTKGYAWGVMAETGISGTHYLRRRANAQWVRSWGAHTLSTGLYHAQDKLPRSCNGSCMVTSPLFMGGFQFMGAYRMGQLSGDELAHAHATYMYRLSDGGLFRQKSFAGVVAEVGDAWSPQQGDRFQMRRSMTVFLAMDSRIGDLYIGLASGSGGVRNLFLQLGRRFQF